VIVLRRTQLDVAGIHKPRLAVRFAWRAGHVHGDAWLVVGRFVRGLLPAIGYRGKNFGDERSQHRHAATDNGDIGFDNSVYGQLVCALWQRMWDQDLQPQKTVGVVPGRIGIMECLHNFNLSNDRRYQYTRTSQSLKILPIRSGATHNVPVMKMPIIASFIFFANCSRRTIGIGNMSRITS